MVENPDDSAVLREEAVLQQEGFTGLRAPREGLGHLSLIVRVDTRGRVPLLRREPEHVMETRTHVAERADLIARTHLPDIGDARHVLDQASIPLLDLPDLDLHPAALADLEGHQLVRLLQLVRALGDPAFEILFVEEQHLLGVMLRRDVDHDPVPCRRSGIAASDEGGAIVDPDHTAVVRDQPVLEVPRFSGFTVPVVRREDDLPVVGVEQLDPDVRLLEPFTSRVAENLFDVRAHEQRSALVVRPHLVHDGRHTIDESSIAGFRYSDLLLGASARS